MLNSYKIMDLLNVNDLVALREMVENECKLASTKTAGGINLVQRRAAANKYVKDVDKGRPSLRHDFKQIIRGEEYQCFCCGFTGVILNASGLIPDVIDPREEWDKRSDAEPFEIGNVFDDMYNKTMIPYEIDIPAIIARDKSKEQDGRDLKKITMDNKDFNTRVILPAIKILGGTITAVHDGGANSAVYLKSENGYAILLPLRRKAVEK